MKFTQNRIILSVIIYVTLFFLFVPASLFQVHLFASVISYARMFLWITIILIFFIGGYYKKNIGFNMLVLMFVFIMGFSTVINKTSVVPFFNEIGEYVIVILFTEIIMESDGELSIECMLYYFFAIITVNTITVIFFPDAMYANNRGIMTCWFLGEDNYAYGYYIIATVLAMIDNNIRKKFTAISCIVWLSTLFFVFKRGIATGIVCELCMIIICIIMGVFKKFKNKFGLTCVSITFIVTYVLFIYARRMSMFQNILLRLNRDSMFSGRIVLWDKVLPYIRTHFWYGNGVLSTDTFEKTFYAGLTHTHNLILQFHFWGGIIAVVLFIMIIQFVSIKTRKNRSLPVYAPCFAGLMVMAVRFIMETSDKDFFWVLLVLVLCGNTVLCKNENEKKKIKIVFRRKNHGH